VDFGEDATDNSPDDVWCGYEGYAFGADASFVCDEDGCR